jgi:TIR domain
MAGAAMGAIFISYRREDTEGHAGRLFEDLRTAFGDDSVFMDVAGIEPGRDFRKVIDTKVAGCSVLLCLIGRHWLGVKDAKGRSRLDDPADFVRLETGSALRRDISVVPVLVHGASMPTQDDLPADLKELAFRNAVELTHARWDSDMQVLITALRKQMSASAEVGASAAPAAPRMAKGQTVAAAPPARSRSLALIGVLVAAVLAGGGFYAYRAQAERAAQEAAATRAALDEAVRVAAAKAAQENERLAALQAQQALDAKRASDEQAAKLKADRERAAQQQRDEQDRIARQKAEEERLAKLKTEQERSALQKEKEKAEQDRIARQKAEDERLARLKAEQDRAAQLQAEQDRLAAAKKAEEMRMAKLRAERPAALRSPAADPRLALQGFGTNGLKVRSVTFDDGNGKALGFLKQSAAGRWVETDASGSDVRFQFAETGRDEWSVYLNDSSRNMRLQLDLNTRKVMFAAGGDAMRGLYRIVMAQ